MADTPTGPRRLVVLYRDTHWLCFDKPPGVPTTPSGPPSPEDPSVVGRARAMVPKAPFHHPFSRLDTQVSGVVLLALTRRAMDLMQHMKRSNVNSKKYIGILSASPAPLEGEWTWAVGVDPRDPRHRVAGGGRDPKEARSRYATEVVAPTGEARVALWALSGRTHQLRVHARAAGAPILGDPVYGGPRRVTGADGRVEAVPRVLLHAAECVLPGSERVLTSALPEDLLRVWRALVPGGV